MHMHAIYRVTSTCVIASAATPVNTASTTACARKVALLPAAGSNSLPKLHNPAIFMPKCQRSKCVNADVTIRQRPPWSTTRAYDMAMLSLPKLCR